MTSNQFLMYNDDEFFNKLSDKLDDLFPKGELCSHCNKKSFARSSALVFNAFANLFHREKIEQLQQSYQQFEKEANEKDVDLELLVALNEFRQFLFKNTSTIKEKCVSCNKDMIKVKDPITKKLTGHLWRCPKCTPKNIVISIG